MKLLNPQIRLWQLISPSLPIGMFAWSQGLEYAVETGWVGNEEQTRQWLDGQLNKNIGVVDIPLLIRFDMAWRNQDSQAVIFWSRFLVAVREANELNIEDQQLGKALAKILIELEVEDAKKWSESEDINYLMIYSLAIVRWQIPLADAIKAYLWSWAENQVVAAIKLVPLGHLAGQRILSALINTIDTVSERARSLSDDEIGSALPAIGIASANHEIQYTRLFRS